MLHNQEELYLLVRGLLDFGERNFSLLVKRQLSKRVHDSDLLNKGKLSTESHV